jgi:microcystin-dependent protein
MDPFLGEIRCFGFNFAPNGWFTCNGQLLSINQYTALFSLLGTYYGGNGTSTFGLPNLQGAVPIGQGTGPGLSTIVLGELAGTPTHQLLTAEMPAHTHTLPARAVQGTDFTPAANESTAQGHGGSGPSGFRIDIYTTNTPGTTLLPNTIGLAGGSQPHDNMQPSLVMNWCIAWQGVYPARP